MIFGVPKEIMANEYRVGLTPTGTRQLILAGHQVVFEAGCGKDSGFQDQEYLDAGATIAYSREEVFGRADFIAKIKNPTPEEYSIIPDGKIIGAFAHLLLAPLSLIDTYLEKRITAICYEEMVERGIAPLRVPASEIGGRMTPQIAARFMETESGGRGKLLMGIPGVPAATVAIIGCGVFGYHSALSFHNLGINVIVLDRSIEKLRQIDRDFQGHIDTMMSNETNIQKVLSFSDVVITAAHIPGQLAPKLVTREMLKKMIPRSLIIDAAIDQGGNCETSRPTTLRDPVFVVDEVLHYCVPNMTSNVSRTASRAHSNVLVPILQRLASFTNIEEAVEKDELFRSGAYVVNGKVVNPMLSEILESKKSSARAKQEET